MMRSSIESLIKLPLQIPFETSVPSKEADTKTPVNNVEQKKEMTQVIDEAIESMKIELANFSNGYIKYPAYDFF